MKRSVVQRIIPLIFILFIVGLVIAAIVSVVRIVTGNNQPVVELDGGNTSLLSTAATSKVRMTVRGPIVGNEEFRSYQVAVTPGSREFTRYAGYIKTPIADKSYSNNTAAYDEFVHALSKADLAKGTPLTGDVNDTRGVCATGQLHEFEIFNDNKVIKRLWTSSCKGSAGSLAADVEQLRALFLAQVPDAAAILTGRSL